MKKLILTIVLGLGLITITCTQSKQCASAQTNGMIFVGQQGTCRIYFIPHNGNEVYMMDCGNGDQTLAVTR